MNAVSTFASDFAGHKAEEALAAADAWLDTARPIIIATFKLDDLIGELKTAEPFDIKHPYSEGPAREAARHVGKVFEDLNQMLEGIRDNFICDQLPPQPARYAPEHEWDARDEFYDFISTSTLSVKDAVKRIENEWNEAFMQGKPL